jgi:nucleotide-binding universal stress UspA family protein
MRVLIAVDGSEGAFEAIDQITPLLTDDRDEVAFYCSPPHVKLRSSTSRELLDAAQESFANSIFAEANKRLRTKRKKEAATILGHQDPRHGVLIAAQQWKADLIVVGARGLNTFQRLLLGSVSRAVVHNSDIPVWVARPRKDSSKSFSRVLLACESPATAARPTRVLTHFHWPQHAAFAVVTIIPSIFAGHVPDWLQRQARGPDVEAIVQRWAREHDAEMQDNAANMKSFLESLPAPLSSAEIVVIEGEPTPAILSATSSGRHDLVVIGTRRKWSTGTAILGRVSEAVLNHADCSVLVVPHPEAP